MNAYPQIRLQIAGHTDSTGTEVYNQRLSEGRADSVKMILINCQVVPQRISAIDYSETQPIASYNTPSGRQINRRVAITIEPLKQQTQGYQGQRY